tara:strand:+ start:38264 stop:38398 length:135 start_codon:yes stop_codon:yes gene_type:complete
VSLQFLDQIPSFRQTQHIHRRKDTNIKSAIMESNFNVYSMLGLC